MLYVFKNEKSEEKLKGEKMIFRTPIYKDENAKELNEALRKFMEKLEIICIGFDEELINLTVVESERREKEFSELMKNPEEFHKVIDLIDKKSMCEEFLTELKDIVYKDYEETEVTETNSFLTSKATPRLRKQSDCANFLADQVKPHIRNNETRRNEIAKIEGVAPQTITNRIKQVYGEETDWKTYVSKVQKGDY